MFIEDLNRRAVIVGILRPVLEEGSMAGGGLCRHWWLLPLVILGTRLLSASSSRVPMSPARATDLPPAEVLIFLREWCTGEINATDVQDLVGRLDGRTSVDVMPKSLTCETRSRGLGILIQAFERRTTKAVIAAVDLNTCEVITKLAHLWNKTLLTWTCPLRTPEEKGLTSIVRLSPSFLSLARALAKIFLQLRWKSVAIVGTDREPWSSLGRLIIAALRDIGIIPRHYSMIPDRASAKQIRDTLKPLHLISRRATVLCLPLTDDSTTSRVLTQLDTFRQARTPDFGILMVHTEDDELFLPESRARPSNSTTDRSTPFPPPVCSVQSSNCVTTSNVSGADSGLLSGRRRFLLPENLSRSVLDNLLVVVPHDRRYDVRHLYSGTETYVRSTLARRLNESLEIFQANRSGGGGGTAEHGNKMFTYTLLDGRGGEWRPLISVEERNEGFVVRSLVEDLHRFVDPEIHDLSSCALGADCSGDILEIPFRATHIVAIILGSALFALVAVALAALVWRHLSKKRMSKGPYKIILTASDFVFPQFCETRRVEEGIETMLCCCLQQLQNFGAPEIEKPDLIQGSVGTMKHGNMQTSTGSLNREALFKEPCARYNGDLVQLKELPCQGTFELKSKAIDVLVTIHGLRHENLNPLIGCLNEPTRPCLVSEYCSRGSLEDVLVQDEIKLDWSFRLSLLTDLVRGMKYLHGTPVRVHGYLTSRNCVIDARWVLKITDYGLPAFYEAQNIVTSPKTARDLLWTAPELLRHPNLQKKGTQAGDVYSFGIIMQEVVLRGEPFCMLALSPEDIIEKVKRPPPLIRPSVSKGAAPPEAINIMRQCWAESADMRPDFNDVHDLFKKLNHGRKVNFVDTMFQMLEKYSNNLEELIRKRTEQLDMEKKKTEQLLNRMLPSSVAEKLKLGMPVDPEEFNEVTIYFSDIVGFTTISAYSTPFQVVDLLNDLYTCFDATINAYNVYKVETIGDAYMVVGGCPVRIPDHATQIATMALDLLHQSGKFKVRHLPKTQLRLRIGLHTGPCCAGVVGLTMPRYCLFGDTVNTASRMESTGAPWRIHLSQATRDRLTQVGGYHIEYRGTTDVKGKGKMPTYWLLGKQGFEKELPTPPPLGADHGLNKSIILGDSVINEEENPSIEVVPTSPQTKAEAENGRESEGIRAGVMLDVESLVRNERSDRSPSPISKLNTRKVAVSVHNERTLCNSHARNPLKVLASSYSLASASDFIEPIIFSRDNVSRTAHSSESSTAKGSYDDTQPSRITPLSATDVATHLLTSSSTSLASISSSVLPFRASRHGRKVGGTCIDEDDLSTPYNHYRCISPNESHGRASGSRFLKRQFSLDRADEPCAPLIIQPDQARPCARLFKQNSAGAANDLERIEEVPATPGPHQSYRHPGCVSLSVESLSLR